MGIKITMNVYPLLFYRYEEMVPEARFGKSNIGKFQKVPESTDI